MKYITELLLALFFFIAANIALGQGTVAIGVKGGISFPNLSAGGNNTNPINTGYKSRLGPEASVFADFSLSDHFSIQPMLEFSSQGGKKEGLQAFPTPAAAAILFIGQTVPPYLYANFKNEIKLSYLMLPVLAKFGFDIGHSPFRIYADAGPFAGYLLAAKDVTKGAGSVYYDAAGQRVITQAGSMSFDSNQDVINQLKRFNAGIEGNLGIQFKAGNSSIFIEGGGNYGFVNLQKESSNGENKTGAVNATIGYSYRFGGSSNQ